MRRAARAIIIKDDQLLVMHRNKFGKEYDTLPGGNVEIGETPEQALVREIDEETTMEFTNPRLIFIEHAGDPYGDQYIYLCDYKSGEPKLREDSEEQLINQYGKNLHDPMWLPLSKLPEATFVSENLRRAILNGLDKGWPTQTLEITG